ncbi:ABC transporter permease, partial [Anaerovibrio sp.]|uniref:ABC transporter permease n=1 Tax=Anaerovibrio sp. TaxID=1872532 RepID=UPI003F14488F
ILADISNRWGAERTALALGADRNALAGRIAPVEAGLRVLSNPTQGYLFFFLIGLAMAAFQQGIIFAVGASILHEYEQQEKGPSFRKLLMAKAVFYWCLAMLSYFVILAAIRFGLDIHLQAPLWKPVLLGAAYSFCMVFFAAFAASLFRREVQFIRASIMYPVPAFILSGYAWPAEAMGPGMQLLASIFPMSYLSNNVRELFLMGTAPDYWHSMAVLLVLGTACGCLAAFFYKPHRHAI